MASMSNYLENKLTDHLFRSTTFPQPATVAIALCTAAPTDVSTGATIAEVADAGSYARQSLNPSDANWSATQGGTSGASSGSGGTTSNATSIVFPTATADWGTVTHAVIADSATWGAGNVLLWGALDVPQTISNGHQFQFNISALQIRLDD